MGPLQFDNPADELEYFLKSLEKDSMFNTTTNQVPIAIAHETDEIAVSLFATKNSRDKRFLLSGFLFKTS